LGNFLEISLFRYSHGRDKFSLKLPDGSEVLLSPEWPPEWQGFDTGRTYKSAARWLWKDSSKQPTEIVFGLASMMHGQPRTAPAPFTWLDITATIARVDEARLPEAVRSDGTPDKDDNVQYSNWLGGNLNYRGTLFTSFVISPVATSDQTRLKKLESSSGWIAASENCQFKSVSGEDDDLLAGLTSYKDRVGLLRVGTSWVADGGPRPGEPIILYSTGRQVQGRDNAFSVAPFESMAIDMVHAVKLDGADCAGINVPANSQSLMIQFGNGRLALIEPSNSIAIVSSPHG
jgi:hypothetical protein